MSESYEEQQRELEMRCKSLVLEAANAREELKNAKGRVDPSDNSTTGVNGSTGSGDVLDNAIGTALFWRSPEKGADVKFGWKERVDGEYVNIGTPSLRRVCVWPKFTKSAEL